MSRFLTSSCPKVTCPPQVAQGFFEGPLAEGRFSFIRRNRVSYHTGGGVSQSAQHVVDHIFSFYKHIDSQLLIKDDLSVPTVVEHNGRSFLGPCPTTPIQALSMWSTTLYPS